jgi:hypothetical protein
MENDNGFPRLRSSSHRMKSRVFSACAGLFTLGAAVSADAALVSRLNGAAVYDTDLNITWIADTNLAASNNFGVTSGIILTGSAAGQMNWNAAQAWLAGMNAANYLGYDDWRLPVTLYPDATCSAPGSLGQNCTGSDLGHLFYLELGGTSNTSIFASSDPDLNKFQNLKAANYWSTDITYTAPDTDAFVFQFANGGQGGLAKTSTEYAWAVRTGDVVVPLPSAGWLMSAGLLGLFGHSWRNRTCVTRMQ